MLLQYAREHHFPNPTFFVDDGVSGVTYDRPGFQAMLAEIEAGRVAVAIAKDLSRLGRNSALTGLYTNFTFPQNGVRFIAINDNYDTIDPNRVDNDFAGINVTKYKYVATCAGSMIAGLGGLYYVMDYACGVWSNNGFGDRGWLAIALVIFTVWRPNIGVFASFLFGGLYILHMFIPSGMNLAVKELYKMLPYVITILVLVIVSMQKKRENDPPASLGLSYFREER